MKYLKLGVIALVLVVLNSSCQHEKTSNLTLLSKKVPTDTPLIFGRGLLSTDAFEFAITFSPEMDELYFTRRKPEEDNKLYTMRLIDGQWTKPEEVAFSAKVGWDFEPHINPKGDKLYFGSLRPLPDSAKSSGLHQWYLEKTEEGWGSPVPLPSPISDQFAMFLTSTANDHLYFTSREKGATEGGIFHTAQEGGQYLAIEKMGEQLHEHKKWVAHPYIAPDESYLIFDAKKDSAKSDLYISFNQQGVWTKAYHMGNKINTDQTEMCPSVSPDGKYLFFHRGIYEDEGRVEIGNIYWVDFIQLKKELLANIDG